MISFDSFYIINQQMMIKKLSLALKDPAKNEDYRCTVCLEVEPSMMRCTGPCKTPLCLQCATNISKTSLKPICPQRCTTEPLLLQSIPSFYQQQFMCPYQPTKCRIIINGLTQLEIHANRCLFLTPTFEQRYKRRKYECSEGHLLYFLDEDVIAHAIEKRALKQGYKCKECGEHEECRSFCNQCSSPGLTVAYCYECRPIPCTQNACPNGHQMVLTKIQDRKALCDICGFSMLLYSDYCYFDKLCLFSVCEICYQNLPKQEHHLVPLATNERLKRERGMSLHEIILKKLMKNGSHQDAIRQLVNLGRENNSDEGQELSEEDEDAYFQGPVPESDNNSGSNVDEYSDENSQQSYSGSYSYQNQPQPQANPPGNISYQDIQDNYFSDYEQRQQYLQYFRIRDMMAQSESFEIVPLEPTQMRTPIGWEQSHGDDGWLSDYDLNGHQEL